MTTFGLHQRDDLCSCPKDRGMFGAYGRHWLVWDSAYTERRILSRLPGESDSQLRTYLEHGGNDERKQNARALLSQRENLRETYRRYEGQELSIEPCPQYQAAIDRKRSAA